MPNDGLVSHPDGVSRCWWPGADPLYVAYHDQEWGRPVTDEHLLFEHLCLEVFQAGLSWITILRKREAFRRAFAGFDPAKIAAFGPQDVVRLMDDVGIVRNRRKIDATIANARCFVDLRREGETLATLMWRFEPRRATAPTTIADLPATSPESHALSRELKQRGWTFVGPTGVYACMQAVGIVNDHLAACALRGECLAARARIAVPV